MELKNAVAVCLISLCSATLVVLIARSLDNQAAARLEPHLLRISEELQAIRKQGGMAAAPGGAAAIDAIDNGLIVYYFHSNARCPTCRSIESQAQEAVRTRFAAQLESGELVWRVLNYEQPVAAELATKFGIQAPVVVLARMKDGQIEKWTRLDRVWPLVGDKPAFIEYVRDQIQRLLETGTPAKTPPNVPVPE